MARILSSRPLVSPATLLVWTAFVLPVLPATWDGPVDSLRREARQWEERGQWSEARKAWEQILIRERSNPEARQKYLYCLRRAQLVQRNSDASYRRQIQDLNLQDALQVYGEIIGRLKSEYVDHDRVEIASLFRQGLDELRLALTDETFRHAHLVGVSSSTISKLLAQLDVHFGDKRPKSLEEAQALVREIAFEANKELGLKPTLVVLEIACGACNFLDEYTYYLTPNQFNELNASWKGEVVGTGIELCVNRQKQVSIYQVMPGSSAHGKGLKTGDRVLRIAGRSTANMAVEAASELLKGDLDSAVEIDVLAGGDSRPRIVKLKRQVVQVSSVSEPRFLDPAYGLGYLQIAAFQETTPAELDAAILKLQMQGMKVLLLDLRGNCGGLFDEARQVAERFLSSGIIVSTQGQVTEYNATYYARPMSALAVPLVVLVDGETASSAEMVAGALKDNLRGRLVGKTTFGKGSIQKVRKLGVVPPAGIRMTVAKFFSPRGQPYTGVGVSPHLDVAGSEIAMSLENDPQVQAALDVARSLALGR